MRRAASIVALIVTALLLQTTVFSEIEFLGAKPELIYLLTILVAMLEGPGEGAVAGFLGGMAQDFLLNQPKGITALTLTLLGYAVGLSRQYIVTPSPLLPVLLVSGGTFCGVLFYGLVVFLLGQMDFGVGYLLRVALLTGLYGALLTPLVYPVIRRLMQSSRVKRIVRW